MRRRRQTQLRPSQGGKFRGPVGDDSKNRTPWGVRGQNLDRACGDCGFRICSCPEEKPMDIQNVARQEEGLLVRALERVEADALAMLETTAAPGEPVTYNEPSPVDDGGIKPGDWVYSTCYGEALRVKRLLVNENGDVYADHDDLEGRWDFIDHLRRLPQVGEEIVAPDGGKLKIVGVTPKCVNYKALGRLCDRRPSIVAAWYEKHLEKLEGPSTEADVVDDEPFKVGGRVLFEGQARKVTGRSLAERTLELPGRGLVAMQDCKPLPTPGVPFTAPDPPAKSGFSTVEVVEYTLTWASYRLRDRQPVIRVTPGRLADWYATRV